MWRLDRDAFVVFKGCGKPLVKQISLTNLRYLSKELIATFSACFVFCFSFLPCWHEASMVVFNLERSASIRGGQVSPLLFIWGRNRGALLVLSDSLLHSVFSCLMQSYYAIRAGFLFAALTGLGSSVWRGNVFAILAQLHLLNVLVHEYLHSLLYNIKSVMWGCLVSCFVCFNDKSFD